MKFYGSLSNRLEENQKNIPFIQVGMGVTEYLYSDREAYEVTKVITQKHIVIRKLDHIKIDNESYSNNWKLISNSNNKEYEIVYRYNSWCYVLYDYNNNKKCYQKTKLRFGKAEYYYDYEF